MCSLDRVLGIWCSDFWLLRPLFLKYWGLHFAGFKKENVNLNISGTGALIKNHYNRFLELCLGNTPAKFWTTALSQFFRKWRRSWKNSPEIMQLKFRLPIQLYVNLNLWGTISQEGEVRLTSRFCILFVFSGSITYWKIRRGHFLPFEPPLALSQVMQENMILAYYTQIWKFSPRLPKMEFFQNFSFFWKGLQISHLTSPQPPPDIKFKSSYARKLDFGLLCPNMEIQPQAPRNGIFPKFFIFLKRSSNFASNEPSTTCRHKV